VNVVRRVPVLTRNEAFYRSDVAALTKDVPNSSQLLMGQTWM